MRSALWKSQPTIGETRYSEGALLELIRYRPEARFQAFFDETLFCRKLVDLENRGVGADGLLA